MNPAPFHFLLLKEMSQLHGEAVGFRPGVGFRLVMWDCAWSLGHSVLAFTKALCVFISV